MVARSHFYERLPGWFDFQDVYKEAIARAPDGARFVELGVYEGASLSFLAVEAANSGKRIQIYGVDKFDWPAGVAARVSSWIVANGFESSVHLITSLSWEAAKVFADGSLDFVFVDAGHDYGDVRRDLLAFFPKLKPSGYMAGHDWGAQYPGVERACTEFFPAHGHQVVPCSHRSWIMLNRAKRERDE